MVHEYPVKAEFAVVYQAVEFATRAVQHGKSVQNYDVLAYAQFMNGQPEAARGSLEAALKLDPDNASIRSRLERLNSRSNP